MYRYRRCDKRCFRRLKQPDFCGTWKIFKQEFMIKVDDDSLTSTINGTVFTIDDNNEVAWKVADEAEDIPLFASEFCRIIFYSQSFDEICFLLPNGDSIRFEAEMDTCGNELVLRYQRKFRFHCQKIHSEDFLPIVYTLISALNNNSFSDLVIKSSDGQLFKVHKCILKAVYPLLQWNDEPQPLSLLSTNLLSAILNYAYSGVIPTDITLDTLIELKLFTSKHTNKFELLEQELSKLIGFNKIKAEISNLTDDFHDRFLNMCKLVNGSSDFDETITKTHLAEPSKFLYTLKQILTETVTAFAGQVLLTDIYSKHKFSKSEKKEMIKIIGKRANDFLTVARQFTKVLHKHLNVLTQKELTDLVQYLLKDIEKMLQDGANLADECKTIIDKVLSSTDKKRNKERKEKKGAKLIRLFQNVLHVKELTKLKKLEEGLVRAIVLLNQRSEELPDLTNERKLYLFLHFVQQFIDEDLPRYIGMLDFTINVDDNSSYKDVKYAVQIVTLYVKWLLGKLDEHLDLIFPLTTKLQRLVCKNEFDDILHRLLLTPESNTSKPIPVINGEKSLNNTYEENVRPTPSVLPACIGSLYISKSYSDLEFVVHEECLLCTGRHKLCEHVIPESIPAHCVIIASRCKWFKRALESGMRESIDRKFYIEDCSPHLFRLFLRFIYYGSLELADISSDDLIELMALSDRYEVDELNCICQNELIQHHMTEDSVMCLLSVAHSMSASRLKKAALNFICRFPKSCATEDYDHLPSELKEEIRQRRDLLDGSNHATADRVSLHEKKKIEVDNVLTDSDSESDSSLTDFTMPFCHAQSDQDLGAWAHNFNPPAQENNALEECVYELRNILGIGISRAELIRIAILADNDVNRALNFYFAD